MPAGSFLRAVRENGQNQPSAQARMRPIFCTRVKRVDLL